MLGLDFGGNTKAYPLVALEARPDEFAGRDVVVFFDSNTRIALACERSVGGAALTFRVDGELAGVSTVVEDEETGSRWMAFTGRAVEGPLKGETLGLFPTSRSSSPGPTGTRTPRYTPASVPPRPPRSFAPASGYPPPPPRTFCSTSFEDRILKAIWLC